MSQASVCADGHSDAVRLVPNAPYSAGAPPTARATAFVAAAASPPPTRHGRAAVDRAVVARCVRGRPAPDCAQRRRTRHAAAAARAPFAPERRAQRSQLATASSTVDGADNGDDTPQRENSSSDTSDARGGGCDRGGGRGDTFASVFSRNADKKNASTQQGRQKDGEERRAQYLQRLLSSDQLVGASDHLNLALTVNISVKGSGDGESKGALVHAAVDIVADYVEEARNSGTALTALCEQDPAARGNSCSLSGASTTVHWRRDSAPTRARRLSSAPSRYSSTPPGAYLCQERGGQLSSSFHPYDPAGQGGAGDAFGADTTAAAAETTNSQEHVGRASARSGVCETRRAGRWLFRSRVTRAPTGQ